jgi:3-oxoacyl-[acyl-carrier-protein] synthase II
MALEDSGLEVTEANAERIGAHDRLRHRRHLGIEETTVKLHEGGVRKISPFYVPSTIINMLPGQCRMLTGIKGPNFSAVSACATVQPFDRDGDAHDPVRRRRRDDRRRRRARLSPTSMGGFCAMRR